MDQNLGDFDMDDDFYLSVYGKNKSIKPQKIKAYALYKQLSENAKKPDNLIIAANDTKEISVSFNGRSDCKVFPFDKVLCSDVSQVELYDSLAKSLIQDVIMGLNCFLIICDLASPNVGRSFESKIPSPEMVSVQTLIQNILKELFLHTKDEENTDSSLHASFFEVHDNKIIDYLSNCHESKDLEIFKIPNQNYIEIKNLVAKPLVDESDITELFHKQSHNLLCYASICNTILTASLVRKNVSSDGFESIKVGKLTVVDFAKCKSNILEPKSFEDSMLTISECSESLTNSRIKIFDILRPAFGGSSKTSIIVTFSSVLYSPEKDLSVLQFVSEVQKAFNYPEIDMKLIIPISLKEYSEEIQELQKDFNAISKGTTGIRLKIQTYRFFKNSIALENEKVKALNSFLSSLTDSINAKKQSLIGVHANTEIMKSEVKEVEKCSQNLKLELEKMKEENNVKQISSIKVDEIIATKQMRNVYEFSIKKLKSELTKTNRNYGELMCSLDCLKNDMVILTYDIDAEQTSLKSKLDLLMEDIGNALSESQTLHENLIKKLKNLSDIDVLIKTWRDNMENLLSKFSSFIEEHNRIFDSGMFKTNSSLDPLHTSQTEVLEIIRSNRSEKWPVLSYYFHKIQVFCDSSFKILTEIIHQLDVIQSCYKTELKTIGSIICSSSKTIKKFVSEISSTLKISQQYFDGQGKDLIQMTDLVCFHHKFKKQYDDSFNEIKHSLLALKQMCLNHNDVTICKWNEIQKDCLKISQKHADLSENLFLIHKQMSSYTDNLAQQKLNALGYPQLKDKTENVESKTQQLLQIHKEMKAVAEAASELNKKGTDKELQEVKEYMNSQKTDVEKYFNNFSLKIKTSSNSFLDDLKSIQHIFSSNKEDLKNNLDFLSSSISSLTTIYDNYQLISNNILKKSGGALYIPPIINTDTNDNMPEIESIFLDEWKVPSSTPNITEKKVLNITYEKEKMLSRIKSVVEEQMSQQISQKLNVGDLDSEGKERKNHNTSTMSLPNLSTNLSAHSKAYQMMGKNLPKLKFSKKQT